MCIGLHRFGQLVLESSTLYLPIVLYCVVYSLIVVTDLPMFLHGTVSIMTSMVLLFSNPCFVDVIELKIERDVYSVVEGEELEVCAIVVSGSPSSDIPLSAHIVTNGKSYQMTCILY